MNDAATFSEQHGLTPPDAPISVRNDAPPWLCDVIIDLAYEVNQRPAHLRSGARLSASSIRLGRSR